MAKYNIPQKPSISIIEINGKKITLKSSFADKMDFATFIEKNKDKGNNWFVIEVIKRNLPPTIAKTVMENGSVPMIMDIFNEIVANKMGMTKDEYLAKQVELAKKK